MTKDLPTPINEIIDPRDVVLLQYAYSDVSAFALGLKVQRLLAKFAIFFGPSINDSSLRHAMLAYTAAFAPISSGYERMEYHSNLTCQELREKTSATLSEADLFAVCLLIYLSCWYNHLFKFRLHLHGFLTIMKELIAQATTNAAANPYFIFWPLTCELIQEGSQRVSRANSLVLEFYSTSRQILGQQTLADRAIWQWHLHSRR